LVRPFVGSHVFSASSSALQAQPVQHMYALCA
jgi:hypothetical protein